MNPPHPSTTGATPMQSNSDGTGSGVVDNQTQDRLNQVVDQAQDTAGHVTQQAKQQATTQLGSQKDRAIDSLVTVAQALRQTSQHLHQQEQGMIAGYVDQVAERVESVTNHLRSRDVLQLLSETQDLARRRPGLFIGGAIALGFVGGRFLMSSGPSATASPSSTLSPVSASGITEL